MSGTSLDGLDIAYCEFRYEDEKWTFKLWDAVVKRYPAALAKKIAEAQNMNASDFMLLDVELGRFFGRSVKKFVDDKKITADFIASHGHTIFHQPKLGLTTQIGSGVAIQAEAGLPVVFDFRSLDVLLGGQGAPLVPIGDKLLFADYDICLNLGGIANLSADVKGKRRAFDVCFCNMPLNLLMNTVGKEFDRGGQRASEGEVDLTLLNEIRALYRSWRKKRPSLGREMFEKSFLPILRKRKKLSLEDRLATCVEATAIEIVDAAKETGGRSMLCTGGGAFNSYLISRILHHSDDNISIIVPDEEIVKFKEALVFAFLGVLRVRGENNCLASVTGASRDNSGGVVTGLIPIA